jgi:hypothetical protein
MKDKLPFIDYQRAYCLSRCYVYECVFITCQDAMFMDAYEWMQPGDATG